MRFQKAPAKGVWWEGTVRDDDCSLAKAQLVRAYQNTNRCVARGCSRPMSIVDVDNPCLVGEHKKLTEDDDDG